MWFLRHTRVHSTHRPTDRQTPSHDISHPSQEGRNNKSINDTYCERKIDVPVQVMHLPCEENNSLACSVPSVDWNDWWTATQDEQSMRRIPLQCSPYDSVVVEGQCLTQTSPVDLSATTSMINCSHERRCIARPTVTFATHPWLVVGCLSNAYIRDASYIRICKRE